MIIAKNPKYVWGGSRSEEEGLDCSGYIYLAAKRAGIAVTRTTAYNMARGLGGWAGLLVKPRDLTHLDLTFWTWPNRPDRQDGHVGVALLEPGDPEMKVTHASLKRGVVEESLKGPMMRDITTVRRLSFGD